MISAAAAGIAHLNQLPDVDGAVTHEPLLVNYSGKAVPSMSPLPNFLLQPTMARLQTMMSLKP